MSQFLTFAHALKNDEDGATMIEYSLLAALVSVIVIATLTVVGENLDLLWGLINDALSGAVDDAGGTGVATPA